MSKLVDKLVTMLVIVRHLCPGHAIPEHVRPPPSHHVSLMIARTAPDVCRMVGRSTRTCTARRTRTRCGRWPWATWTTSSASSSTRPPSSSPRPRTSRTCAADGSSRHPTAASRSVSRTRSPAAGVDPSDVSCVSCQGAVFRDEVTQMLDLVDLRSYIRLYSSITIQKVPYPHVKLCYSTALQTFPFSLHLACWRLSSPCPWCVCCFSCLPSRSSRTTAAASLRTTARPLTPSAATSSSSSTSCS